MYPVFHLTFHSQRLPTTREDIRAELEKGRAERTARRLQKDAQAETTP
jgi:hypothetical protein